MLKDYHKIVYIISFLIWGFLFCSSPQKEQPQQPISVPPTYLFDLNNKETVSINKCSCSIRKLPMESGAGAFGNAFMSRLTPESDREFELTCKGSISNKTKYKLQNVQIQWEYLSSTKFPIQNGPIREYKNNYIFPNALTNISIVIGKDTGIKNFFTKEVKHYDCILTSVTISDTMETIGATK